MKKKIFIIFGVILVLISAFQNKIFAIDIYSGAKEYVSDMLKDPLNNGEISQELYDDLMKQADEEISKAQMTDKIKENLFFFAVGQYANISEDVALSALLQLADIYDYIFWDNDSQSFGFDEGIGDYIKNGLDSIIYIEPDNNGLYKGYWYKLPKTRQDGIYSYVTATNNTIPLNLCDGYVCYVNDKVAYATYETMSAPYIVAVYVETGQKSSSSRLDKFYQGNGLSGYCSRSTSGHGRMQGMDSSLYYTSLESAEADFYNADTPLVPTEPVLTEAIIVNENPVFPSLSPLGAIQPNYKTIVTNNYINGNSYPPDRGLDINYYNYDYNYDVPFWGGQDLETLEYPVEIEFPSIEFETIAIDENVDAALESLDGSWIVRFFLVAILLLVLGLIL